MSEKRISNAEVIVVLKEVLAAMEVKNFNFFKVRAYQNAIAILDNLTVSIYDLWENKRLSDIPGIGEGISSDLADLFTTGKVEEFERIKRGLPDGMFALIGLRSIGAKKAFKLADAFSLTNRETALEDLKKHAEEGEIKELEGFAEKSEAQILEAINSAKLTKNSKERMLFFKAEEIVDRILSYMLQNPDVIKIEAAGSFRRKNATVGDLDFPVATNNPEGVIDYFLNFSEVDEVLVRGDKKTSVVLTNGMQVDIRVCDPKTYGSMLQYFTGSKQHNILIRSYALERKMSLSEYGIKEKDTEKPELLEFPDEEGFYNHLGLDYIVPELRNGNNEIEFAKEKKLPNLVEQKDIKGDVHTHTVFSDGHNTLQEMVSMAKSLGYEYYGVSDHAPSIKSRGLKEVQKIITDTKKLIKDFNDSQNDIKVLYGYEVNILSDATLALPDEILSQLDYVIAGIHSSFNQNSEQITQRLVAALENPYINIIAHPSGRILNSRDPIDPNWNVVFGYARDNKKILEINSQPDRLDLPDDLVKEAKEWGVKMIINTDSHDVSQFSSLKYGIYNARRGWADKKDIINTLPYEAFVKELGIR